MGEARQDETRAEGAAHERHALPPLTGRTRLDRLGRSGPLGLAVTALILVALRLHAFDLPLETDECNYAYIAGRLLESDRLYVDVWDHQPPGVFALFAGVIALFGDDPIVFRWMAVVFSVVSLALVYAILRMTAGTAAALTGALLFAVVSADPGTAGEGCNREIYMNTLILAAWYLACRARSQRPTSDRRPPAIGPESRRLSGGSVVDRTTGCVFASGCLLAVASVLKTLVAVHWLFLAVWLAMSGRRSERPAGRFHGSIRLLVAFALGPLLIWTGTFTYFWATGRSGEFVDAVFLFNLSYSGAAHSFSSRFLEFFAPVGHRFIFDTSLPLWIATAAATALLAYGTAVRRHRESAAVLLLLVSGYVAVCLPAHFWPHYYYLLIPPAVITTATALWIPLRWHRGRTTAGDSHPIAPPSRRSRLPMIVASALSVLLVTTLLYTQVRDYLSQPPFGITVRRYNSRDFWGRAQGENVRRVTDPDDEIFVFGNDAEIYYYARRRCASRFTMITGLQARHAGSKRRREILIEELTRRLPRVILILFDEKPFPEWLAFLDRFYGPAVGVDYHDRNGDAIMFVFARRDEPIETIDWNWDRSSVGGWMPEGGR